MLYFKDLRLLLEGHSMRISLAWLVLILGGCVIEAPPREVMQPAPVAEPAAPPPAVAVYEEPPIEQPEPIAVGWAPPPMLVEVPPPPPFAYAVWVGGYWVWQGNWVWAQGHWMAPPRPEYVWVHPYYEHRGDVVIFINGHWAPQGVAFAPPPPGLVLAVEPAAAGVISGPRPIGPEGCFVPAPPGSRLGIIVPAPVGTAPAVVTSAPPVVAVGMRVTNNVNVTNIHNTNVTNITNVTNVTRVTNVTIVAPPGATANGRGFSSSVPAAPHLAAARPAMIQARAPQPQSMRPVAPYVSAHAVKAPAEPAGAPSWKAHPQQGQSSSEPPPATAHAAPPVPRSEAAPAHPAHPQVPARTEHASVNTPPAKNPAHPGDVRAHKTDAAKNPKQQAHGDAKREEGKGDAEARR
jgi:hypothetical protein